ncbi:hypothetical protein [Mycolicibacterium thermoresistibile]|uniref:Uncharacterized protein n=1 Tax=Mycolicibacterium thermoresistibile (strain ATCC 19527 / DSM 44167 / CIP 105390 / JCM 6362 / NCTC 10409 / 316) TaxID=1078020 RepID=G7CF82_MYCT3|nr:hypothetical protein [Mycolicibacterium thermoresistibile]EHI13161.1 hypothetical protein KEK_08267 [Mycolicibacterium thermoresistibile ATCC 19527]MCV7187027.1 hypothetical protein [Mycolicibacterium thermoresistibile]SNW20351.1 Uncharacterised protein [Mycolicibacterium thermoresistibile]
MCGPRWAVAECLHEHVYEGVRQVNLAGEVLRDDPAECADCGLVFGDDRP